MNDRRPTIYMSAFDPRFQIGPLGYWNVGDEAIMHDGTILVVGSLDLDGMAIAWRLEHLQAIAWERDIDVSVLLDERGVVRTGYNVANLTESQKRSCVAIAAAGRRQREVDDEALAA